MGGGLAAAAAAAVKREGKVCAGLSKHHVPPPGTRAEPRSWYLWLLPPLAPTGTPLTLLVPPSPAQARAGDRGFGGVCQRPG